MRKLSYNVGVERMFPIHSPNVAKVDVVRQGRVRRAKLYYLRTKKGKFAKVEDREFKVESKAQAAAKLGRRRPLRLPRPDRPYLLCSA